MKLTNTLPSKAIVTSYVPCTNTRGSRIKATDNDGNTLSMPSGTAEQLARERGDTNLYSVHASVAMALITKMGWKCERLECGSTKKGYVYIMVD